jgi:cysteine desulfurase family protein (TIGR01976 family)
MTSSSLEMTHGLEQVRAAFPALKRVHGGNPVAYFDGPGGTQVASPVLEAMQQYLVWHNANTHWAYPSSEETDALLLKSREALCDFLNCAPNEVVFGQNMTTLTFHLARALGWNWGPGDEIVVTDLDHHANIAPWKILEKERGVLVRHVPFNARTGQLVMSEMGRAITTRTRLVAVGAASNALGTVNDLDEIIMMARGVDALVFVDAVHSAAHLLPDARALDCDFMACSAYKFYGPHIGVMFAREEVAQKLEVPRLEPAPSEMPERLETGTGNHEGMVGAAAAVDFLADLSVGQSRRERLQNTFGMLHATGQALVERMWDGLGGIRGVQLYGPPPNQPRTPTLAFTVNGISSEQVARSLAADGLFLSHGDFYATTVTEKLGVGEDGVVRAGAACYTTRDEVDRLVRSVAALR